MSSIIPSAQAHNEELFEPDLTGTSLEFWGKKVNLGKGGCGISCLSVEPDSQHVDALHNGRSGFLLRVS